MGLLSIICISRLHVCVFGGRGGQTVNRTKQISREHVRTTLNMNNYGQSVFRTNIMIPEAGPRYLETGSFQSSSPIFTLTSWPKESILKHCRCFSRPNYSSDLLLRTEPAGELGSSRARPAFCPRSKLNTENQRRLFMFQTPREMQACRKAIYLNQSFSVCFAFSQTGESLAAASHQSV